MAPEIEIVKSREESDTPKKKNWLTAPLKSPIWKDPRFILLAAAVVLFAVYMSRKSGTQSLAYPDSYNTYPASAGSGGSGASTGTESDYSYYSGLSYLQDAMTKQQKEFSDLLAQYDANNQSMQSEYQSQVAALSYDLEGAYGLIYSQNEAMYINSALAEMENNSNLWYLASTEAERSALHARNQELGAALGLRYDNYSGQWLGSAGAAYIPAAASMVRSATGLTSNIVSAKTVNPASSGGYSGFASDAMLNAVSGRSSGSGSGPTRVEGNNGNQPKLPLPSGAPKFPSGTFVS